jgi:hypothetical protein
MRLALIAFTTVLLASPALAQTDTSAPAASPAEGADKKGKGMDDPNRIVCKREHVVGSNRPQKVCMTVAERQRLKDHADRLTGLGTRAGAGADVNAMPTGASSN